MKQLQYIIELDKRNLLKNPLSELESRMVYNVLIGMTSEDYSCLSKHLNSDSPILTMYKSLESEEHKSYNNPIKREDYKRIFPKTESFDCLLKWVIEKKKGKMSYAKNILRTYFHGYSDNQQKKILRVLLLQAPGDRKFAHKKLYGNWDDSMIPYVLQCWNTFHDDTCAWLIIKIFPFDIVKKMAKELAIPSNFSTLCKRLGNDMPIYPEKDLFAPFISIVDYLNAISHTQYTITESEAEELLYRIVSVAMYGLASDHEYMGLFKGEIKMIANGKEATTKNFFRIIRCDVSRLDDINDSLIYFCKMGLTNVVENFLKWNDSILEHYNRLKEVEKGAYESCSQDDTLALLLYLFPDKYRNFLDYSECIGSSWLSVEWWHVLLKKRERRQNEDSVIVNFDHIRKLSETDFSNNPVRGIKTFEQRISELSQRMTRDEAIKFLNEIPVVRFCDDHGKKTFTIIE